jgi:molecular chaperone DnaK
MDGFDNANIKQWVKLYLSGRPLRVWGIDLGTTNSTVAEIAWSPSDTTDSLPKCRCLELDQPTIDGMYTSPVVPSVVALRRNGEQWIGEGAKRLRARPQEQSLVVEKSLFFETKNDMGLRKTYYRAPETHNQASKIAGHILQFLYSEAEKVAGEKPSRVSVTVPASFQISQRQDTLYAATQAGCFLNDYDLLDEPTAALIDYLFSFDNDNIIETGISSTALVFDFGGGTCDVSILEVQLDAATHQLRVSPLSVSRYHRLGGGDLDAAIVHEYLIPALLSENGLDPHDLGWADRKRVLEPQLLGTAEALKIALCSEITRLQKFEKYHSADKQAILASNPALTCKVRSNTYTLKRPTLNAQQWETLLEPFLDRDFLFTRETEYRLTQSVFAPLQDALSRANLNPRDIDICLLAGGSTLVPQVQDAIANYFENARLATFPDPLSAQVAVARGAAWHALHLAVTGKPLVQPMVHDAVALITAKGNPYTLVPADTELPFPADGSFARLDQLVIPHNFTGELRFEIVTASTRHPLLNEVWSLPPYVDVGDRIICEYRLTVAKQLECRVFLADDPHHLLGGSIEKPLYAVVNPHQLRVKIEELEEQLRVRNGGTAEDSDTYVQLARWYAELRQTSKAIDYLKVALQKLDYADAEILNLMGIYYGALGDFERQEKSYREADKNEPVWAGPMFNLALAYRNRHRHAEALDTVNAALRKDEDHGPALTLKALCLQSLGQQDEALLLLRVAVNNYDAIERLEDFELGWYLTCASTLGDSGLRTQIEQEQRRRLTNASETGSKSIGPEVIDANIRRDQ